MFDISALDSILNLAISETDAKISPQKACKKFFTIDGDNRVNETPLLANTFFESNCWTFCIIKYELQTYGWYTHYILAALLNKQRNLVNKVQLTTWTLSKIEFSSSRDGHPNPKFTFSLNKDMDQSFEFYSLEIKDVQTAWNFFLEIDEKCETVMEAKFYFDYFIYRIKHQGLAASIEQYKADLEQKNNLIDQHKTLLQQIDEMVKGSV